MARVEEYVDTPLGSTKLTAYQCETCGVKSVRELPYVPNQGWLGVTTQRIQVAPALPSAQQQDFCGVECLLRFYIPDAFADDSPLSQDVIARLQVMISELG